MAGRKRRRYRGLGGAAAADVKIAAQTAPCAWPLSTPAANEMRLVIQIDRDNGANHGGV